MAVVCLVIYVLDSEKGPCLWLQKITYIQNIKAEDMARNILRWHDRMVMIKVLLEVS